MTSGVELPIIPTMCEPKKFYLIRHGETESNRKGIFRGRLDIPLSEKGKEQAFQLRTYFENFSLDAVFTSPLSRAVETAEIAFPGKESIRENRLNNLDLGEWSGKSKALIKENFPGKWEVWKSRPESICFPGGEQLSDVYQRVKEFLARISTSEAQNIAAVSHRSVVKLMLAAAAGLEHNYYWKFHLDNASISVVYFDGERGFTIVKINETHHLEHTIMEWY